MTTLRIYIAELRCELLKVLRMPGYTIPTLGFPVLFYLFFGVMLGNRSELSGVMFARYLLATYGASGVVSACLFGLGAGVAVERGQGWLQVKRASPMPTGAYVAAKLGASVLFATAAVLLLALTGATLGGVRFAPPTWLALVGVLALGSIPFCALGLAIGYLAGPNSAAPVVNLLFFPLVFLSGLWLPIRFLPEAVQRIAPWLPAYHLGAAALAVIGSPDTGSVGLHLAVLAGFSLAFTALAVFAYRRDEGKTFG